MLCNSSICVNINYCCICISRNLTYMKGGVNMSERDFENACWNIQ